MTILTGPRVSLRPVAGHDVARLASIRREPEVAARWGDVGETEVENEFVGEENVFAEP